MFGHISPERVHHLLSDILATVQRIERRIVFMSGSQDFDTEIANLTQAVTDTEGAEASAETVLTAIPGMIEAAIQQDRASSATGQAAQLSALSDLVARLRAGAPKLAAAVAATKPASSTGTDTTGGATAGDTVSGAAGGDTVSGATGIDTTSGGSSAPAGDPPPAPSTDPAAGDAPQEGGAGTASGGPSTVSGGASS